METGDSTYQEPRAEKGAKSGLQPGGVGDRVQEFETTWYSIFELKPSRVHQSRSFVFECPWISILRKKTYHRILPIEWRGWNQSVCFFLRFRLMLLKFRRKRRSRGRLVVSGFCLMSTVDLCLKVMVSLISKAKTKGSKYFQKAGESAFQPLRF